MKNLPVLIVPLLILALPLLEIAAFIVIGSRIGVLATLATVFATAVIGIALLRLQGFGLIRRIREETDQGQVPGRELVHGAMLLLGGLLLIVPGFVTDSLGFLLFVPAIREFAWRLLRRRMTFVSVVSGAHRRPGGPSPHGQAKTIDLDASEYEHDGKADTPWRRN